MSALGEGKVKFASAYLLTRDREFQTSAKRLVGAMSVIFQEMKKGGAVEEVVIKNLFARAELLVRDNHKGSEDELSYAWVYTDFVIELNNAFRIESTQEALEAWRRRLMLVFFQGDFSSDPELVSIEKGIYLADAGLEAWVESGVAGYIHLTRGIIPLIEKYSYKQLYDKLNNPTPEREALNETFLQEMTSADSSINAAGDSGRHAGDDRTDSLLEASLALARSILENCDNVTDAANSARKVSKLIKGTSAQKAQAWDNMKEKDMWRPLHQQWGRKVPFYFPVLTSPDCLVKLHPDMAGLRIPLDADFPELFDEEKMKSYVENTSRKHNLTVILQHIKAAMKKNGPKGGYHGNDTVALIRHWTECEQKLECGEKSALDLLTKVQAAGNILRSTYAFSSIGDVCVRSRRHVQGFGTQGTSKHFQSIVQPFVIKLDFRSCFLSLGPQTLKKLALKLDHPAANGKAMEELLVRPDLGAKKITALSIIFGKKACSPQFHDLEKDGRVVRWVASALLPNIFEAAVKDKRRNPDATCGSRLLEGVEDWCTETMVHFIRDRLGEKVRHLVWEFDGVG